jgi:hypothetical protein
LIAGLLAATPLAAAEGGFYLSFKLGTADVEADIPTAFDLVVDGEDDLRAYEAGYRLNKNWAVQVAHHDLGTAVARGTCSLPECGDGEVTLSGDTTAFSISIVPQYPFGDRFSIFGKLGLVAWDTDVTGTIDPQELAETLVTDISEEDMIWGLGLRVAVIGSLEVFYEYEGLGSSIETQAFGLTWHF